MCDWGAGCCNCSPPSALNGYALLLLWFEQSNIDRQDAQDKLPYPVYPCLAYESLLTARRAGGGADLSLLSRVVSFGYFVPVDHVPKCRDVIGSTVLIF